MIHGYPGGCERARSSGALRGTSCSRGIAIGLVQRVRVGERPLLHGDWPNQQRVLVTDAADARALAAAPFRTLAVVAEAGGIGSNLAILLRELGVPAVLDVVGACAQLEDGMTLLVDGNAGMVLVLSEPVPSPGRFHRDRPGPCVRGSAWSWRYWVVGQEAPDRAAPVPAISCRRA